MGLAKKMAIVPVMAAAMILIFRDETFCSPASEGPAKVLRT
jgi:hypothetical protein